MKNVPVSQNRWSLRGFIIAISFKRIKSGLLTEEFWQRLPSIFICCTQRLIITHRQRQTRRAAKYLHHLWVTSAFAMTEMASPVSLPLPCFSFGGAASSSSCSFLPFPSLCRIAVVSYGFLFLRDGRWAHVGVEATKHTVRVHQAHGSDGRHL